MIGGRGCGVMAASAARPLGVSMMKGEPAWSGLGAKAGRAVRDQGVGDALHGLAADAEAACNLRDGERSRPRRRSSPASAPGSGRPGGRSSRPGREKAGQLVDFGDDQRQQGGGRKVAVHASVLVISTICCQYGI